MRNSTVTSLAQTMPSSATELCNLGGDFKADAAHVEWVDGKAHETGFTTGFPPNAKVTCTTNPSPTDVDWINQSEGRSATVPTFAAFAARSYHPAGVLAVMLDGSVHLSANSIDKAIWQAASTRDGGESATLP